MLARKRSGHLLSHKGRGNIGACKIRKQNISNTTKLRLQSAHILSKINLCSDCKKEVRPLTLLQRQPILSCPFSINTSSHSKIITLKKHSHTDQYKYNTHINILDGLPKYMCGKVTTLFVVSNFVNLGTNCWQRETLTIQYM